MGTPTLRRLVDQAALDALLTAASAVSPGLDAWIVDGDGTDIAEPRSGPAGAQRTSPDTPTRSIVVDGRTIGAVAVRAEDEAVAGAVAELIGRAIELAATEGLGRRAVTGGDTVPR